jgi:hypothetical protein
MFDLDKAYEVNMTSTLLNPAQNNKVAANTAVDPAWSGLYKLGSISALASVILIPITIAVYFIWPPPTTVTGHFTQIQESLFVGLLGMDLLYLVGNLLLIPTWLALYVALRRANEFLMSVAITLGLISFAALIAGRPILEMVSLSGRYAAAATEMEQSIYLAAGEAMMVIYHGTAFSTHYLLGTIGLLIISFVMLQSDVFSRRTAYVGIAANVITLGYYVPVIGVTISIFSVFFYFAWYLLIVRRLWQLSGGQEVR